MSKWGVEKIRSKNAQMAGKKEKGIDIDYMQESMKKYQGNGRQLSDIIT